MDSSPALAPLIVLGVAGLGLFLVALAAVLLLRPGRRSVGSPPSESPRAVVDDLSAFHARPPGFPGAPPPAPATGAPVPLALPDPPLAGGSAPAAEPEDDAAPAIRFLLALTALALALIAGAAAAGLPAARADHAAPRSATGRRDIPAVPDPPAVPDSPAPGQPGAGGLAYVSLPLGPGGTAARLSFGTVVLEQQAVGATVTRPAASLTASGRAALLHLRMPTWNCLAPELPDDPAPAGCVPSVTQYGDLPSPALSTSSDGTALLLQGRVPVYTRPNGSGPVYTGQVYDVTLTVRPGRRLGPGRYLAEGVLTLGSGTTRTDGDPVLDVLTRRR